MSVLQLKNCNLQTQPDLSRSQINRLSFAGNLITVFFSEYLPQNLHYLDLGKNYLADDGIPLLFPDSIQGLGIIDSDYHGEIGVILHNDGQSDYIVQPGERIAQLLFMPVVQVAFKLVEDFTTITDRGEGGFGHTGRH